MKLNTWPNFTSKEADAVKKILLSNKVNYLFGDEGKKFEDNFSKFCNVKHSLAVANGTLALDLCLRSIQINQGDEVIVTGRTFIASASSISILGGTPVFVDVDPNSQNIDVNLISKAISKKTKAIICVHFAGYPCNMPKILEIAKQKNLFVIEDCAQAHGAMIGNKSVGSFGDINAWSFCNDKIMTTGGEGGMITTNSSKLYKSACAFNNHGKNFKKFDDIKGKKIFSFPLIHDSLGSNYRMTEMQSVLGNIQINRLKKWNKLRNRNAEIMIKHLKDLEIINLPLIEEKYTHAYYKFYIVLNEAYLKKKVSRKKILMKLQKERIPASFGSSGRVFAEKGFKKYRTFPKDLPVSSSLEKNSLMFEVHPNLTHKQISHVAMRTREVLLSFQS